MMLGSEELGKWFVTYRQRFWPGRLRRYRAICGPTRIDGAVGECVTSEYLLIVDPSLHSSEAELRSTLLHEMAHAAAGSRSRGHDSRFLAQLEHLLENGAAISMGLPETGNLPTLSSVPERFRRARRALEEAYRVNAAAIEGSVVEGTAFDKQYLSDQFAHFGEEGLGWNDVLLLLGRTYGLIDVDGKPLPSVVPSLPRYRRAHRTGRTLWRIAHRAMAR